MSNDLHRSEAQLRAQTVGRVAYQVALDLTTGPEVFRSTTVVRFDAEAGAETFVDLVADRVLAVELNGVALDPGTAFDGFRVALPALAGRNVLTVEADCRYSSTGEGLHRFVDPVDEQVYVYTQFEPFEAHRVFACFDQPDLKASWTLTVRCPSTWLVVSTTTGVPSAEGDVTRWDFPGSAVVSTYLYALAAGPFARVRSEHGPIPMDVYCRATLAAHLDADAVLTVTRQGFDHFRVLFDQPYPFGKYDQVFVPEFNSGAMENVACVLLTERLLFRSQVTRTMAMRRAEILLHELAHMWFGNLVTMRWWDDLWLNESFATYASVHALVEATEFTEAWTYFSDVAKTMARTEDQLPSTHPVIADAPDIATATANFDGITYAKGASVLRQLVAWVGEDAFFRGLRTYFTDHAWGNTEFTDLLRHLERSSGRSLTDWSRAWLHTTGVNTVRGIITGDEVVLEQSGEPIRPHRIGVAVYRMRDGRLANSASVTLDLTGSTSPVPGLPPVGPDDIVLVNDADLTYAKVRLDPRSWHQLIRQIDRLDDTLARSVCWGAAWDMTRDAEVPTADYLALVLRGVATEADLGVVERLLQQARTAVVLLGAQSLVADRLARLSDGWLELARTSEPGSDRQRVFATAFIADAVTTSQSDRLRQMLAGRPDLAGLAVDSGLRWAIVRRLAALDRMTDDELTAELARDDTTEGRLHHLTARASRPDPAAKAEAWQLLTADTRLSHQERMAVIEGFNLAEQPDLLRPYLPGIYGTLGTVWSARADASATAPLQLRALLPTWDATLDGLARTDQALSRPLPGSLRRVLEDSRAEQIRALRCRERESQVTGR
ncbi:aminopeptidase N [Actinoplanes sp. NPDC049265]|uniref:aminopeptidase N n=1 Tax=Actinoplanes sp. NPDC049265 TaxID=3363902 RepID=UPI0037119E44